MFGPKRTSGPYFLCSAMWMSCARLLKTHDRRGILVREARKGPGTCRSRRYERRNHVTRVVSTRKLPIRSFGDISLLSMLTDDIGLVFLSFFSLFLYME